MMSEKKILAAIKELQQSIDGRFDDLEKRLGQTEKVQQAQSRDIATLFERVDELCQKKPVWRSKDGRGVGILREDAYALFKELGFGRLEALRAIEKANRLMRDGDGKHLARSVRAPNIGLTRAVVILVDD